MVKRAVTRWKKHRYGGSDPSKRAAFDKARKAGNKLYKQGRHVDKKVMRSLYERGLASKQHNKAKNPRKPKKKPSFLKRLLKTAQADNPSRFTKYLPHEASHETSRKKEVSFTRVRLNKRSTQTITKSEFDYRCAKVSDSLNKTKALVDWTSEFFKTSVIFLAIQTAMDIKAVVVGVVQAVGETKIFLRMVEVHPEGKVFPSAKEFEAFVSLLKEYKGVLSNLVSLANDFRKLVAL